MSAASVHALSRAVRFGDQEWLQEWLEASLWDGRSWVLYSDEAEARDGDDDEASCVSVPDDEPPNGVNVYPTSLLHKVLEECQTDALPSLLRLLLRHGADPNLYDDVQDAPLHVAARRSDAGEITIPMLLRAGANIHARNAAGNTAWHEWAQSYPMCAGARDNEDMTRMFARILRVDHGNNQNWTVLHFASRSNHALANLLIQSYGANIHAVTADGQTPLHLACRFGSVLCVRHLLAAGAFLYVADNRGRTPFHEAAVGGFLKIVELCQAAVRAHDFSYSLLNLNVACRHGTNVLHNAVVNPSALQVILQKGAPVKVTDTEGWTAFHYACWIGQINSMQLLWEKAPELLHQKDARGHTPLHVASFGLPQANLLLEKGHDLAPLRQAWWSDANKDVVANDRWRQAGRSLPHLRHSHPTWTISYLETQLLVVQWLLTRGAVVLVADEFDNFPMAYTSHVETLYALVRAAVREGLF